MTRKTLATLTALTLIGALILWALPAARAHEGEEEESVVELTLLMGEFYFQLEGQQPGEPIRLEAGKEYLVKIDNVGQIEHEAMFGQGERFLENGTRHDYMESFFHNLTEFELEEGNAVIIEFEVPEEYAGQTFEIGCFIPGHYEAGMKIDLIVE